MNFIDARPQEQGNGMISDIIASIMNAAADYQCRTGLQPYAICMEADLYEYFVTEAGIALDLRLCDKGIFCQRMCGFMIKRISDKGYGFYITGKPYLITVTRRNDQ